MRPLTRSMRPCAAGKVILARSTVDLLACRRPPARPSARPRCPTLPLIFAVATSAGMPAEALAVRGEDHVADVDAGALGGRVGKYGRHLEALGNLLDRKANALEVAAQRLLELRGTPSGRSSGRTCRRTPCGARRSCPRIEPDSSSSRGHLLEVAVLDERLRLVADRRLGDAVSGKLEVERDSRKRRDGADEESEKKPVRRGGSGAAAQTLKKRRRVMPLPRADTIIAEATRMITRGRKPMVERESTRFRVV